MADEILQIDGSAVVLSSNTTATLVLEQLAMPEPTANPEWVTAADSEWAALTRAPLHQNREITAKVKVSQQANLDTAFDAVGALVDKFQKAGLQENGIPVTYTAAGSSRPIIFDCLQAEIEQAALTGGSDDDTWFRLVYGRPTFTVKMVCKPYWRRPTEENIAASSSTAPVFGLTLPAIGGDVPALGRLVVTDPASQPRRFLEWGLEQRDYTASASLIIDSDSFVVTSPMTQQTVSGAYDPNATGASAAGGTIYRDPSVLIATGTQPHIGTWRVRARIWVQAIGGDADVVNTRVRLTWQDGDGPLASNAWVTPPLSKMQIWQEVDLGSITVSKAIQGTQKWNGRVDGYYAGTNASTTVYVDYLKLIPASEGYGKAKTLTPDNIDTVVARDGFVGTTAGVALNARAAVAGGSWVTSGATTDFTFEDLNPVVEAAQRSTAVSEATPRFAILGTTSYTNVESRLVIYSQYPYSTWLASGIYVFGVIARWTSSSSYVVGEFFPNAASMRIRAVIAGASAVLAHKPLGAAIDSGRYYRLRLMVLASGVARLTYEIWTGESYQVVGECIGSNTALATGGSVQTGQVGFSDQSQAATGLTRHYDDFTAGVPAPEQLVISSGQSIEVRHDDVIRTDSAGTTWGRPGSYRGTHFLIPPAGADNKTARVAVSAHRVDLDTTEMNPVNDNLTARVFWTERGLSVPRP